MIMSMSSKPVTISNSLIKKGRDLVADRSRNDTDKATRLIVDEGTGDGWDYVHACDIMYVIEIIQRT